MPPTVFGVFWMKRAKSIGEKQILLGEASFFATEGLAMLGVGFTLLSNSGEPLVRQIAIAVGIVGFALSLYAIGKFWHYADA